MHQTSIWTEYLANMTSLFCVNFIEKKLTNTAWKNGQVWGSGFYCLGMVPVFLSVGVPGYLLITDRYLVSADINIYGSDIRK